MARPFKILIALCISTQLLTGCGTISQLISTIPSLRRQLAQCQFELANGTAAKRALLDQFSRQAAIAQACMWGIQICPESLASPQKFRVKIGEQFFPLDPNPWLFDVLVGFKLSILSALIALCAATFWRMYFWMIKPEKNAVDTARNDIMAAENRVRVAKLNEQRIREQIIKLKMEFESETRARATATTEFEERRDGLVAEIERLEERRRLTQAANDLVNAAFTPRKR
jgi:hypothetical protein